MNQAIAHPLIFNRVTLVLSESANVVQRQGQQRQVSAALEQVSLYPAIPPQAILVVRHLADPRPETLLANNSWQGVRTWERAAQEAINDCWRTAIRVARSPVDANANSVWFADRAEWLACLSWDLAMGIAGDRWWWQTVLRSYSNQNQRDILYSLWQAEIQWLPATFSVLFQQNSVNFHQILQGLSATQTKQLLTQLMTVYQCSVSSEILSLSEPYQQVLVSRLTRALTPSMTAFIQTLAPRHQLFMAVCLNGAIATDIQQILQEVANTEFLENEPNTKLSLDAISQKPNLLNHPEVVIEDLSPSQEISELETEVIAATDNPLVTNYDNPQKFSDSIFKITEIQSTPLEFDPDFASNLTESPLNIGNSIPETDINLPVIQDANSLLIDQDDHPIIQPVFPAITEGNLDAAQGVQTSVGGLWYLVNLLVELDWLGRSPLITPWQQLLILSQSFLPEIPPDPVWGLLAEIVGEPLPAEVIAQWEREFLPQVTDYLDGELQLSKPISDYILEPATLYFTRTHIDVVFKLEQIQFDLRVAGLDRDPNWVPELARVITFHYE